MFLLQSAIKLLDFMRLMAAEAVSLAAFSSEVCVALPHSLLMWGFRGIPLPFVLVDC
jgi:hypothetical protein